MKRIYFLVVLAAFLAWSNNASAQIVNKVVFFGVDSIESANICPGCNTEVSFINQSPTIYAQGETAQITIDWGDGNTETNTVNVVQQNYLSLWASHAFSSVGVYTSIFYFSDNHGNVDSDTIHYNIMGNCGAIYTYSTLDIDNDGFSDAVIPNVLYDVTDNNGNTNTYSLNFDPNLQINPPILGLDPLLSPYEVKINSGWLNANNLMMSPNASISYTVNLSNGTCNSISNTPSFLLICDPSNPSSQVDLGIKYAYGSMFRAGMQTGFFNVNVCNYSCSGSQNADLNIDFDPLLTVVAHNIPGAIITGNTIHANIWVDACELYTIYFAVPGTTPVPTPLLFTSSVTAINATDFNLSNNTNSFTGQVNNSYDPNDKSVNLPEVISPSVADELTYVIRFQNMGNDDAFNIVIKDTLDADLDLGSFELLELSHNGSVEIDQVTRILTFTFPNINLAAASVNEPASHGFAIYKIKEKENLPIGTEITNTAYIYFDFNPAVVTNTTFNVNQDMAVSEVALNSITAFPVPATDYLLIQSTQNQPMDELKVMDITGKVVFDVKQVGVSYAMDLHGLANGIIIYVSCQQVLN